MKIGRNDPCPCGSGKKYKKCCYFKDSSTRSRPTVTKVEPTPELLALKKKVEKENVERRKKYLEPLGIYVDFVKPVVHKGKKFWSLGSRLYYERPPNETFHEFIIFVLTQTIGESWRLKQEELHYKDKHFIYKSYLKYNEWRNKNAQPENREGKLWAAKPDGYTRALISLAFDVCSLVHREHLPENLLSRLLNHDQYQGARYEIAIAAIFARLGYKITFLDEEGIKGKHPEFIAENLTTKEKIAVEVKSKHRKGVLHTGGKVKDRAQLLWGDVQRLYRHALEQNPGNIPFIVFIDLNSPQTPKISWQNKPWLKDIKKMMEKSPLNKPDKPDPCTGLVFTNYSYHYQTDKEASAGEHLLSWPLYPKEPIRDSRFIEKLELALSNYGNIPNLDIEVGK